MKKRAIFVTLATGLAISSAAALDTGATRQPVPAAAAGDLMHVSRTREAARTEQRDRIQARYAAERDQCAALSAYQREKCVVRVHANRGRAMLEAAAPYEVRF